MYIVIKLKVDSNLYVNGVTLFPVYINKTTHLSVIVILENNPRSL